MSISSRTLSIVLKTSCMAMFLSIAMPVFAESAPVYDADSLPQQMDNADQELNNRANQPNQTNQTNQNFDQNTDDQSGMNQSNPNQGMPPAGPMMEQGNQDQGPDVMPPPPRQEGAYVPSQAPSTDNNGVVFKNNPTAPVNDVPRSNTSSMTMMQRMQQVEQRLDNLQASDSNARLESLQAEVQALRGHLEEMGHQLDQLQTRYNDLDKRLADQTAQMDVSKTQSVNKSLQTATNNSLDTGIASPALTNKSGKMVRKGKSTKSPATAATTTTPTVSTVPSQPNVAEEQQIYQQAYDDIKAKKYADAVNRLQTMLQKYPTGQFAANAHYWLGELYGLMNKNDQALVEFNTVVRNYPDSPRISDAQLKIGLIYAAQSKWTDAKAAFKKVVNHYPGTASSRLAAEQLTQLKQAGH